MLKDFDYQINGLKQGIFLYAPVYMYIFLKMYKFKDNNFEDIKDELENNINNICGKPMNKWPEIERQEFINLFTPEKKWLLLQREFIYYLIFSISGYAFNFIKMPEQNLTEQDKMEIIIDRLFDFLRDKDAPWFDEEINEDGYNKYHSAENPLIKLNSEIVKITDQDNAFFLFYFQQQIIAIFKFYISPTIDKLFVEINFI